MKYEKPKRLVFWMLIRKDGSWVGDCGDSEENSPFVYVTRREATESGWNLPSNPCRAVQVEIKVLK